MQASDIIKALVPTSQERTPFHLRIPISWVIGILVYFLASFWGVQVAAGIIFGDWQVYDFVVLSPLIFGGITVLGLFLYPWLQWFAALHPRSQAGQSQAARQMAKTLAEIIAAPTDELLPPLATEAQPAPLMEFDKQPKRIAPLNGLEMAPAGFAPWRMLILSITAFFLTLPGNSLTIFTLIQNSLAQTGQQAFAFFSSFALVFIISSYFLGILSAWLLLLAIRGFKSFRLHVDESGLWWWHWWHREHLFWADVRSIARFENMDDREKPGTMYVIASATQVVIWRLPRQARRKSRERTQRLLAMAATQTGLPLRDLTPLIQAMATSNDAPSIAPSTHPAIVARVAALATQAPPPIRWQRTWGFVALTTILSVGLYGGMRYIHEGLYPYYLQTLPTTLATQQPLLTDAMLQPNGLWSVHQPSSADPEQLAYTKAGYTMSGTIDGLAVTSTLPQNYGAVAIQVTVTESGTPLTNASNLSYTSAGVGMIIRQRSDSAFSYCAFVVDYAGDWKDTCSYDPSNGNGQSAFIHQGPHAINTLLVISRASFAAFYVNGHYLGYFFDSSDQMGTIGRIGLINEDANTTATFTNFMVWQLPMPPTMPYIA
jgi:hypothetical protein